MKQESIGFTIFKWTATFALFATLGFNGRLFYQSVLQQELHDRVYVLLEDAERFGIPAPKGDLNEVEVLAFEQTVRTQLQLGYRIQENIPKAEQYGVEVPKAPWEFTEVIEFEEGIEAKKLRFDFIKSAYEEVTIPKGKFTMGCTWKKEDSYSDNCDYDETAHTVRLTRDIIMMKTEVTQGLYEALMNQNPSHFHGSKLPVEQVSWFDAIRFANALSQFENRDQCYSWKDRNVVWKRHCTGWRLPTEAEWERAARAEQDFMYAGSNDYAKVAWFGTSKNKNPSDVKKTVAVCSKEANQYGLCDMSGNVWEWVWDWYGDYRDVQLLGPLYSDPVGVKVGVEKILRGGGWYIDVDSPILSNRNKGFPQSTSNDVGFRLVRNLEVKGQINKKGKARSIKR